MGLDVFESTVYHKILADPSRVLMIPIDLYMAILYYCEQNELYEHCAILRDLEDKVILKSIFECYDDMIKV